MLRSGVLASLGRYSYAIYVFHKPVHDLIGLPLLRHGIGSDTTADPVTALAYLVATGLSCWTIGWLSWQIGRAHV